MAPPALLLLEKAQVACGQAGGSAPVEPSPLEGLLIRDEGDLEANPTPWAAEARRLARASQGSHTAPRAQGRSKRPRPPFGGRGFP
jgi:hypothetical protein